MGERYEVKKPKDSNLLRGDGQFIAETEKNIEYVPQKGERYEIRPQEPSDIWKVFFFDSF